MSGTKRTPIFRRRTPPTFSLRAIELFEALCRAVDDDEKWRLHGELHDELALAPHVWPAIPMLPADAEDQAAVRRAEALREAAAAVAFNGSAMERAP